MANLVLKTTFDLTQTPAIMRFEDVSSYSGTTIDTATANGYIKVVSPSGIEIKGFDYDNPDIDLSLSTLGVNLVEIPVLSNGNLEKGKYVVTYNVIDSDDSESITESFTIQFDYVSPTGDLSIEYDCATPFFIAEDKTVYSVNGVLPTSTKEIRLIYPKLKDGTGTSDLISTADFLRTTVFFAESSTGAQHQASLTSNLTYSFSAFYSVVDKIYDVELRNIVCNKAICSIYCCLKAKWLSFEKLRNKNGVQAEEALKDFVVMTSLATMADNAVRCNDSASLNKYLEDIKELAACDDCGCDEPGEIVQVVGIGGSGSGSSVTVIGSTWINVVPSPSGDGTQYTITLSPDAIDRLTSAGLVKVIGLDGVDVDKEVVGAETIYKVSLSGAFGLLQVLKAGNNTGGTSMVVNYGDKIKSSDGVGYLEFLKTSFGSDSFASAKIHSVSSVISGALNASFVVGNTYARLNKVSSAYSYFQYVLGEGGYTVLNISSNVESVTGVPGAIAYDGTESKFKGFDTTWQNLATESYVSSVIAGANLNPTLSTVLSQGNNTGDQEIVLDYANLVDHKNRIHDASYRSAFYFSYLSSTNITTNVTGDNILLSSTLLSKITTVGDIVFEKNFTGGNNTILVSSDGVLFNVNSGRAIYLGQTSDPTANISILRDGGITYNTTSDRPSVACNSVWQDLALFSDVQTYSFIAGTNVTISTNVVGNNTEVTINSAVGPGGTGYSVTGINYDDSTRTLTVNTDEPNAFSDILDVSLNSVLTSGNTWSAADAVMSYDGSNVSKKLRDADNQSYFRFVRTPFLSSYFNNVEVFANRGSVTIKSSLSSDLKWQDANTPSNFSQIQSNANAVSVTGKPFQLPLMDASSVTTPLPGMMVSQYNMSTGEYDLWFYSGASWKKVEFATSL